MTVKEALEVWSERFIKYNMEKYGHLPQAVYIKGNDSGGMYIGGTLNDEGYAQWQPVPQNCHSDLSQTEKELGFALNEQVLQFFTSRYFISISGKFGGWTCCINGIRPNSDISALIKQSFEKSDTEYMNGYYFCIGDAESEKYGYVALYVSNADTSVIAVDWNSIYDCDKEKPFSDFSIPVADSLAELLSRIEPDG